MMIFSSEIVVEEVRIVGDDSDIVAAALVLKPNEPIPEGKVDTLIPYLMKHRHGTPFEQGYICVYVSAPIFVFREWHRHRIGFSYNESSARYRPMEPKFYIPKIDRPMKPVENWKPARPKFELIGGMVYNLSVDAMKSLYIEFWDTYTNLLESGVALEVARTVLPVGIYSSMRVTMNPRSLMHFLSLRTHDLNAGFVSYPQWEIERAARKLEGIFAAHWPVSYVAFLANGRVAP